MRRREGVHNSHARFFYKHLNPYGFIHHVFVTLRIRPVKTVIPFTRQPAFSRPP